MGVRLFLCLVMAKVKTTYVCQSCGSTHPKWSGQCRDCGEWNTIVEEQVVNESDHAQSTLRATDGPRPITDGGGPAPARLSTGQGEFDRVLGGGVVAGSLTLVGGDPGIGKSTLMLQTSRAVAEAAGPVLYVTGEESFEQAQLRAARVGALSDKVLLLTETCVESIRKVITNGEFALVIIDSIQSVYSSGLPAVPGSVGQVRDCASAFLSMAKGEGVPIFLVGHVTKDGNIAGPRLLEHLVDTVLYFEGEGKQALRILRGVKNRFGSTNEIGVFEMSESGLLEVANPSELFLLERPEGVSGSVVIPSVEGTRPMLVEVQALVGEPTAGSPRRTVTGVNANRVSLLLAVLEKRAGLHVATRDVFVNVAGGVRLEEPAADLAVALALASSLLDVAVPSSLCAFGEAGLSGEVRAVDFARQRIAEAEKFGFKRCLLPKGCATDFDTGGVELLPVESVGQALDMALER
jgi:DNA repair protein RadA/Sms